MKKILLIFVLFLSIAAANAQDKIITITKDTIPCRIVSVNADRISYEQKFSGDQWVGKSIPVSEVLQYLRSGSRDSFDDRLVYRRVRRPRPEHRWLLSLQGGLAHSYADYSNYKNYLVNAGNSAAEVDDYFKKLENGYHLDASFHYLLSYFIGIGADYNFFYAASKGEFLADGYGGSNIPVHAKLEMNEKLYANFAGISVLFQEFPDSKRKIKISQTLSPGFVQFRNESRYNQYMIYWGDNTSYNGQPPQYYGPANSVSKSTPFGAKGSLAVDYAFTPQLSAGLAGNFLWAKVHKVSIKNAGSENKNQKLQDALSISHLDYGFIVRYNF